MRNSEGRTKEMSGENEGYGEKGKYKDGKGDGERGGKVREERAEREGRERCCEERMRGKEDNREEN